MKTTSHATLDFFLVNYALVNQVKQTDIMPAYKTNHSMIKMVLEQVNNLKRGRGFWKLNASILHNNENLEKINKTIDEAIKTVKKTHPTLSGSMSRKNVLICAKRYP